VLDRLDPPLRTGRPRRDARRTLNGILYHERTGCRWREIPLHYGDDATIHRTFRRWLLLGVFDKIREVLAETERIDGDDLRNDQTPVARRTRIRHSKYKRQGGVR